MCNIFPEFQDDQNPSIKKDWYIKIQGFTKFKHHKITEDLE